MTTLSPAPAVADLVARVEPVLRQYAAQAEANRRLAPEAMAALVDSGVTRSLLPRSLGGLELELGAALQLIEEISRIDSAAGWVSTIMIGVSTFIGLLPPEAAEEIFADPHATCAGALFPPGVAEPVEGGYRVSGQWPFGSGSNYATWLLAQALLTEDGTPRLGADGAPQPMLVVFRAAEAEVLDNWRTLGMRGTGSHDYRVSDLFVPAHRALPMGPFEMQNPAFANAVGRLGGWPVAPYNAVVAVGIARAAIDDLLELAAAGKTPAYTQTSIADRPAVQERVGRARALVDAARRYIYSSVAEALAFVETAPKLDQAHGLTLALAGSFAVEAAVQAVDLVHQCAGTSAIRDERPFQKHFRDIHTLQQHAFSSASRYESVGKILLGRESDWAFYYL